MSLLATLKSPLADHVALGYLGRIADALEEIAMALRVAPPDTELEIVTIDDVQDGEPPAPDESAGLQELEEELDSEEEER